jgi:hypothetical protein
METMSNDPEILTNTDALASILEELGATGENRSHLRCPFHQPDEHGSLSVFLCNKTGRARYRCQACGATGTIIDAVMARDHCEVGAAMAKLALIDVNYVSPRPLQGKPRKIYPTEAALYQAVEWIAKQENGRVSDVYHYTNPTTGIHEQIVHRIDLPDGKKNIMPACPVEGGFSFGAAPEPRPIFNRVGLQPAATAIICEGERCCYWFERIGITIPATTSPGGSKAAAKADWSFLAGKTVIIWPDNDEPGQQYANDVLDQLSRLTPQPTVRLIDVAPLNLPVGGDIEQFVEGVLNTSKVGRDDVIPAVQAVLDGAQPVTLPAPAPNPNPVRPVAAVVSAPAIPRPVSPPPIPTIPAPPTVPVVTTVTSMPPPFIPPPAAAPPSAIYAAASPSGLAGLHQVFNDAIAGRRYPIQMPWPLLSQATRALLPGRHKGTLYFWRVSSGQKRGVDVA